ncbi:MAG TPA: hypothetical protein VFZ08_08150 [Terriglobia bacterium]|nr:hypothetical protein [Terriglobia bacterium]
MKSERRISRREFMEGSIAGGLTIKPVLDKQQAVSRTSGTVPGDQGLTLEVSGDAQRGYGVTILFKDQRVAQHHGEFSAVFQNGDRSLEDIAENWKADAWTGNATSVSLRGQCKLPHLNTTVFVQIDYDVITPHIVRKVLRFHQVDMYMLFYQVSNRLKPIERPAKFWSFDQQDCQGGALHEYYPAVGFRTHAGLAVGLLTDCGYRNGWSRMIRRDGKPVKPAPDRIPDTNLNLVCRHAERAKGTFFVQQTFGEVLARTADGRPGETVKLPPPSSWIRRGHVTVEEQDGSIVVSTRSSEDGVIIPFAARDDEIYSLQMQYRSPHPFAVQMWDVDDEIHKMENLTLYDDRVPESPSIWAEFHTTVFFYSLRGRGGALFISMPQTEQATNTQATAAGQIQIKSLEVRRLSTHIEPYHRLEMDHPDTKTIFIFVDEHTPDTARGYRLASELHLAEALGFKGGETEKILYADVMMLSWVAGPEYFHPMLAPSIWYSAAGEMYLRDSFFALNGIHNRELNEGVFNLWAANQGANGAINTLVEPNMSNLERKSNDSTPLWLMWALQNRRRFGARLPMDKVRKAAEYCLRIYDRNHNGVCWAQFVMGQLDVINYPQGTTEICENQGMLAVTLRVIKELRIPVISERISDSYIAKVEDGYRSYYDPVRKFVRPARQITDALGFGEIFPEFLSLWLFNRKLLTDEMVQNHLDRIPPLLPREDCPYPKEGGTARPIFIGLKPGGHGWSYFTDAWHPMISTEHGAGYADHAMDGIYYNGGSWMRIEICGYVAGKLHGWKRADKAIANRLWAEINVASDFPTSQEYLATDPAHPFFGYHRVFAWNSFVLQALELAGLRESGMDPDSQRR